ncbi:hypothetical protein NXH76_22375 [Blautia schinkii]|nr:hypothetical protein [Blautia schinkii]
MRIAGNPFFGSETIECKQNLWIVTENVRGKYGTLKVIVKAAKRIVMRRGVL